MFSDHEAARVRSQRLAKIARVSADWQPDVAPLALEFDGERLYIVVLDIRKTLKYKTVQANEKVALVVDDLETIGPWSPRGINIHATAEVVQREGRFGLGPYLGLNTRKHWRWGIEGPVFKDGKAVSKKAQW